MSRTKKHITKKKVIIVLLSMLIVILVSLGIFMIYARKQMNKIPNMSVEEMLSYTLKDKEAAITTIGIIKNGKMEYDVYGKDGRTLENKEYDYEIGSLTKTFTCSLLSKAVSKGKLDMNTSIDTYLELPQKQYYPTLTRLVTHTSGYKNYYFEGQMISNFLNREENDFYGITNESLKNRIGKVNLENKDYNFEYSNFGMATLGLVLEQVYGEDYFVLMNQFIREDLGLTNTRVSDGTGNLTGYWNWKEKDVYLPAGSIISNITDVMKYLKLHMTNEISYLEPTHEIWAQADGNKDTYQMLGIRTDAEGMGWMIDKERNIIWHNGGTGNFNCYAGFDPDKQVGVVILSNLSPNDRIPATVIGVKLLQELQESIQ